MNARAPANRAGQPGDRLDPTRMRNQPALRTSSGTVWIVMGGLFAAASLIPLVMFIARGNEAARGAAVVVAVIVVALYGMILIARLAIRPGPARLRTMAAAMLTMAAVALIGVWVSALLANAPR